MSERIAINQVNASYNIPVIHEDYRHKELEAKRQEIKRHEEHKQRFLLEFAMSITDHDMCLSKLHDHAIYGYEGEMPFNEDQLIAVARKAFDDTRN